MVSNKSFICETCGYSSNRKYNLELHQRSPNACEKRLKRLNDETLCHRVTNTGVSVTTECHKVTNTGVSVTTECHRVTNTGVSVTTECNNVAQNKANFNCMKCNKKLANKRNLERHLIVCKGFLVNSLECSICRITFSNRTAKSRHVKAGNCIPFKDEKDILIEELEKQLEERDKQLEENKKQLEEERARPTTIYNTTNNYFDHSINYNNYDNLSVDHITKEDIKRLFDNCRMQYPELSEDVTRMLLKPKENQCIYLPEGPKSNTCAVIKDGIEMRKPMIRVLMDLAVQTGTLIRDSNVIVRNKKDVVNNQFWADNRNACGLNISDIEYMTENDKEMVQRNKNIVLDMSDGKL